MRMTRVALFVLAFTSLSGVAYADTLDDFARDFWVWAAANRPLANWNNDLPRIERSPDWVPDWSAERIAERRKAIAAYEERWKELNSSTWPVSRQVDYRLVGAEIARVRWELDHVRHWERNPIFYLDHTIGALRDRLLQPPPISAERGGEILRRLERVPLIVEQAKANLTDPRVPLARWAIADTDNMRTRLSTVAKLVKPHLPAEIAGRIDGPMEKAIVALESYNVWLKERLPRMNPSVAIGRDAYLYYLWRVALFPYTPEQMLTAAEQYQDQVLNWDAVEKVRNAGLPPLKAPPDVATLVAQADRDQRHLRQFLQDKNLMTIPDWVGSFRLAPLPEYLAPITGGTMDDLTSASRLKQDAVYYVGPPSPTGVTSLLPAVTFSHTGIPGHFLQQSLGWAHENAVRRRFYDNMPNEGIAFYVANLLLYSGYYDNNPRAREILYSEFKNRPIRVQFDVNLQIGTWSFEQADAVYRASPAIVSDPTLTMSNLTGFQQIQRLMAAARRVQGDKFDLKAFHDYLWKNGNVPAALLRWELLGLRDQVDELDRLQATLPKPTGG